MNVIKENVKFDINKPINPIPADINTFDLYAQQKKKMDVKKNPLGFGVGDRFDEDERKKWEKKLLVYNKNA